MRPAGNQSLAARCGFQSKPGRFDSSGSGPVFCTLRQRVSPTARQFRIANSVTCSGNRRSEIWCSMSSSLACFNPHCEIVVRPAFLAQDSQFRNRRSGLALSLSYPTRTANARLLTAGPVDIVSRQRLDRLLDQYPHSFVAGIVCTLPAMTRDLSPSTSGRR